MDDISSLKLTDLKRELRARNLPITGTKQILVDRLIEAMSAEKATDDSNIDDLLDEDSMLGEEESDTGSDDNVVADLEIASPTTTVPPVSLTSPVKNQDTLKRSASSTKADQNGASTNGDGAPPSKKKIILNRQAVPEAAPEVLPVVSTPTAEAVAISKAVSSEGIDQVGEIGGEKAVIKLSEVTAAPISDKLKLRQEKFKAENPTTGTGDAADKLKKRAERFGVAAAAAAAPGKTPVITEDPAKLAKRQERFGIATSEKVDELKQKRAARFGVSKPTADSAEVEEKKKLRAARFAAAL